MFWVWPDVWYGTYQQKEQPKPETYGSGILGIFDFENAVSDLLGQGYEVQVEYKHLDGHTETMNYNQIDGWTKFKSFLKGLVGIDSYTVSVTRYTADKFTNHTDTQAAVEVQDAVYGEKLVNNTVGSFVEKDLNDKLAKQAERLANQQLAVEQAKAATPIQTQKGFPYWVLIILAAVAGVSVEEYVRRRNAKVNSDSSKKN